MIETIVTYALCYIVVGMVYATVMLAIHGPIKDIWGRRDALGNTFAITVMMAMWPLWLLVDIVSVTSAVLRMLAGKRDL